MRLRRRLNIKKCNKYFVFSIFMVSVCMMLYNHIPMYENVQMAAEGAVDDEDDWKTMNPDIKIYILPNESTSFLKPRYACESKLFLLIFVHSKPEHFESRIVIRETWGNYGNFIDLMRLLNAAKKETKHDIKDQAFIDNTLNIDLRNIKISERININNSGAVKENNREKAADGEADADLHAEVIQDLVEAAALEVIFKVIFNLGLVNDEDIQEEVVEESKNYEDILLEDFIDTYNNLTLKSAFMLKWIDSNCYDEDVQFIVKTDDDVFINVPNLMIELKKIHHEFHKKTTKDSKQFMIMGEVTFMEESLSELKKRIHLKKGESWNLAPQYTFGAAYVITTPAAKALYEAALVTDYFNLEDAFVTGCHLKKGESWNLAPQYTFGAAYVITTPAAKALYEAALVTDYFNLEDAFVTGYCAINSNPRMKPIHNDLFVPRHPCDVCCAHKVIVVHGTNTPASMRALYEEFYYGNMITECEKQTHIEKVLERARLYVICKSLFRHDPECVAAR